MSLTIPLSDWVFFGASFEQFSLLSLHVDKSKGVAETVHLVFIGNVLLFRKNKFASDNFSRK